MNVWPNKTLGFRNTALQRVDRKTFSKVSSELFFNFQTSFLADRLSILGFFFESSFFQFFSTNFFAFGDLLLISANFMGCFYYYNL